MNKDTCHQTWMPAFDSWNLRGVRRELTAEGCPLTSTRVPWIINNSSPTMHKINAFNIFFKKTIKVGG